MGFLVTIMTPPRPIDQRAVVALTALLVIVIGLAIGVGQCHG